MSISAASQAISQSARLFQQGLVTETIATCQTALKDDPLSCALHNNLLFAMAHSPQVSPEELFAAHRHFGEVFESTLRPQWPAHSNGRDPERVLRVGFLSADFNAHAVTSFILPLLFNLKKSPRLSLYAYYNNSLQDHGTAYLKDCLPHWNQVETLSDEALAQKIQDDGIDILIDLSGHTAGNRLLALARKPAPIQASWIGYPGTTGLRAVDYYITDAHFTPPAMDSQFTEALARVPAALPFLPASDAPQVNPLPALENGYFTFGSFNRTGKINQQVVALWSRLMLAVPGSRILLAGIQSEASLQRLRDWFVAAGITPERLLFQGHLDVVQYLALHGKVDMCLDTFPYAGGTTTLHALWMGVPQLTLAGQTVAGRGSAAFLHQMKLDAFVASDADEFIQKGVYIANNLQFLAALRGSMRELMKQSPLNQYPLLAAGLEGALRTMWQRWCTGLPAAAFEIEYC
ncbi:hypothetical protein [Massilia sp. BJB1822]|uniref:O-linked N-acetylglucosamine transferase, SPINDLY family protein n=1 Tax=Massilia sp. BJB1822 TaxID=2744470 RepID=UPI0015944EB7|nr:hypothetical protein [Massilia sp. BJB1822]NVD99509.1 hypothetical protein [Massilia sp. BJB1822]